VGVERGHLGTRSGKEHVSRRSDTSHAKRGRRMPLRAEVRSWYVRHFLGFGDECDKKQDTIEGDANEERSRGGGISGLDAIGPD
jgi:hypothetical protein